MCTKSGYMTSTSFFEWFRNVFCEKIPKKRPVLLLLDGHKSHLTNEVIELALKEQIEIFCLPPHTTHLYQPLDVAVFGSLKTNFRNAVHTRMRKRRHLGRKHFGQIFAKAWDGSLTRVNMKSGFRISGLWPINKNSPDEYISRMKNDKSKQPNEPTPGSSNTSEPSPTSSNTSEPSPTSSNTSEPSPTSLSISEPSPTSSITSSAGSGRSSSLLLNTLTSNRSPTTRVIAALHNTFPESPESNLENGTKKSRCILNARCITSKGYIEEKNEIEEEKAKQNNLKKIAMEERKKKQEEKKKANLEKEERKKLKAHRKINFEQTADEGKEVKKAKVVKRKKKPVDRELNLEADSEADDHVKKRKVDENDTISKRTRQKVNLKADSEKKKILKRNKGQDDTGKNSDEECSCLICRDSRSASEEEWIQCNPCSGWAHTLCTDYDGVGFYVCDSCRQL